MDFKLRTNSTFAELTIETGNVKITEYLSHYDTKRKRWVVNDDIIEQLISLADDLREFNERNH